MNEWTDKWTKERNEWNDRLNEIDELRGEMVSVDQ